MKAGYTRNIIFTSLFIAGIFLPGMLMVFTNKRPAQNYIAFNPDSLAIKHIPSSFNAYFNNTFSFRKQIIKVYYSFRVFALREKIVGDKVFIGNEGWLFYANDKDGLGIADFSGKQKISLSQLDSIINKYKTQRNWLQKRGIQFLVVICPDKQTIYPEYLPSIQQGRTSLDQIVEYWNKNSDVPMLDLRPVLLEKKKQSSELLYYKTDTHWNRLGAFYGFQSILKKLNISYIPQISDYTMSAHPDKGGDIAAMLGMEAFYKEEKTDFILKDTFRASLKPKTKWVIFHDSFYNNMRPFILATADTVITRHHSLNSFDRPLIEETNPDIVICEMVERYTSHVMLKKNPALIEE